MYEKSKTSSVFNSRNGSRKHSNSNKAKDVSGEMAATDTYQENAYYSSIKNVEINLATAT